MGADLYIKSISDKAKNEHEKSFQEAVKIRDAYIGNDPTIKKNLQNEVGKHYDAMYPDEGYFRDSYNGTSLLWVLNLSWWSDVTKLLNDNGELEDRNLIKFAESIQKTKMVPITKEYLIEHHCTVDDNDDSPEVWLKYFEDKRKSLMQFLMRAIEMGEPIYCSL